MALSNIAATSVNTVVNSIGVNTHVDFGSGGYQNTATVEASINYLGIKNLRDSAQNPKDIGAGGLWQQIANATGAKFDDYMGEGSPALDTADLAYVSKLAGQGILNFVEGANENDSAYSLGKGNSIAWTASFQQQLYAIGHSLGLPVINMSFGAGWTWVNNWHGDYDKVGDLSAYADYGNAHTYPNPGQGTDAAIKMLNSLSLLAAASRPVITTEIGWNTSITNLTTAAKYTLDAVFDGMKEGNVKTYFYSLFDDTSGAFGLMNQDGSSKPAGAALHNLTSILADSGAARTDSLAYGLTGTTSNDNTLLMEKSDGTFELAVWNEVDAAHTITLTLGAAAQTIRIYDPLTGYSAVQTYANTSSVTLTVPDHPVIVEISQLRPNPVVTVPISETMTAGTALAVTGISVSDPWTALHTGSMTLDITTTAGTVSGKDGSGNVLSGSGTTNGIHISGTLAQLNADLAGLSFTSTLPGASKITVTVGDQAGVKAIQSIAVTVNIAQFTVNAGQSLHLTNGSPSKISAFGNNDVIKVDSGTNTILAYGSGDTLSGGSGSDTIQAFAGANSIKAGSGTETISFAGSNNTIFVGSGLDTLNDSGSNSRIIFGGVGSGTAQIFGYVLRNGDTLDFRTLLAGTKWTGNASTVGNFLKVGISASNAVISVDPSGLTGGASYQVAVLHGSGAVSLPTLLAHSLI